METEHSDRVESPPVVSRGQERFLLASGALLVLAGLLANEHLLARAVAAEGAFRPGGVRLSIRLAQAILIGSGLAVVALRRREIAVNLLLALASASIFGFLGGELLLRAAIGLDVESVRDPRLYAGWCDHDDQWKLRYRWLEESREALGGSGFAFHPRFGWVGEEAPPEGSSVLLYGDSFAYGVEPTPKDMRLAGQLGRLLGRPVANYAVSGYGLDQIYLRFSDTHRVHQRPAVVFSFMTLDLDRAILTVRDAPKPYYRLPGGRLELRGVPLPADPAAWHREHPPGLRTYLGAWLFRRLQLAMGPGPETEIWYRREAKQRLGRALLEAAVAEAADAGVPLVAVVFYPLWELGIDGWREAFFRRELERLGVPWLDTKALLLAAAAETGRDVAEYYYPAPNNHPNAEGYRVVAEALARRLGSGGGVG